MPGATVPVLRARARFLRQLDDFLDGRGSMRVETPAVVRSPGVDAHLDAMEVTLRPGGWEGRQIRRHLATSPEYAMKQLLARGTGRIHQLGAAWRDGEQGRLHEPEFTLLEWYVPGMDDTQLMAETEDLVRSAAGLSGGCLEDQGGRVEVGGPFGCCTWREAWERSTGLDPAVDDDSRFGRLLRAGGVRVPKGCGREELLDLAWATLVQPRLGLSTPEFVTDWPVDRAALARVRPGRDPGGAPSAARFELFACGVELCNGYWELTDAAEQGRRIDAENTRRVALGKPPYPKDETFLSAVAQLPDCAGNALGVDRLLLLVLRAAGHPVSGIADVRALPMDADPAPA